MPLIKCPSCGTYLSLSQSNFKGTIKCEDCDARLNIEIENGKVKLVEEIKG